MALSKILENSITDGVISAAKLKDFAAAVDLNGVELILDADQDTSITADTDDQIDIKISGADDFRFTANTFTALAGSGIVVPDGGLTFGSTAISATAAEINLIDGGASTGTTAVADADGIITNDGGTMRLTTAATFKTYFQEGISTAYDDLTTGDAAVNIATSAGNITIDAQGNDTDIIFKGTDGGADKTFMTIDGSAGGDLFLTGGLIDLKNDGSAVSQIKFYCESSNAHAQTLIGAPHSESATNTLTLPSTGGNSYLLTAASTATVTNKTFTSPKINEDVALTATATEINLIDGGATVGTTAIADGDGLIINDAGTMRVSTVQTLAAYLDDEITAMPNLTSVGTLTALTVDDVAVNGKVITMTGSTDDTFTTTVAANGATSLVTVDTAAAAAHLQITADGTVDIDSAGVLTLDSGAAINIEPAAGSAILLDGTISIDAGVVTGATSITSTAFVGNITGTVATATQNSITTATGLVSVGALNSGTITSGFGNIDTGSSTITTTGAVATGALTTTGASSISTADNLDTLSLISTDADANLGPSLRLYRNSASAADNDLIGQISFDGTNDNGSPQDVVYGRVLGKIADMTDGTEDGNLFIQGMTAGTLTTKLETYADGVWVSSNSGKIGLGTNNAAPCLELYHDGSDSYIADVGPGELILHSDGAGVQLTTANSETLGFFRTNGASELYHDGTKRLFTLANGSETNGTHTAHNFIMGTSSASGVLQAQHSLFLNVDTDNNSTGQKISFRKDATTYNGGTELLRIQENGQIQFGDYDGGTGARLAINSTADGEGGIYLRLISAADANSIQIQFSDSAEANCGTITTNASANSTAYNTSSDYRLKENVAAMSNQITRLKNLKPSTWDWKKAENSGGGEGFIAHELNAVVPLAVVGEKDAMQSEVLYVEGDNLPEGKSVGDVKRAEMPAYQGIDYSKLVPLLTGALQEAITKIETLETKVQALEDA